jgi:N-methylhydantoinase A/oxoprolinase/acetone carboxylase beta subunit
VPTKKITLPQLGLEKSDPQAALKGTRPVYWPDQKGFSATKYYAFEKLRPGNVVPGPAVVEGEYTTMIVPFELQFSIDKHGLGILE